MPKDCAKSLIDQPWPSLDDLARRFGTDKGSEPAGTLSPKDYCRHYEHFLEGRRFDPLRILEIGVKNGASLRMWAEYFQNSRIVGVDSDPECRRLERVDGRWAIVVGHQGDPMTIDEAACLLNGVDFVVDDGSHRHQDIQATFECLWPYVAPGGIYAIEDLHATFRTTRWLIEDVSRFPKVKAVVFPNPSLGIVLRT